MSEVKEAPATPRSQTRELLALVAVHFSAALIFLTPAYIRPDSVGVYSYLRSMVIDGDLLFFNEWAFFGLLRDGITFAKEVTPLHTVANHWSIGTSLLSAPPYLLIQAGALLGGSETARNGFIGIHGLTLAFTAVAFAALTSALVLATCRLVAPADRAVHSWALAAAILGTPFFWYEFRLPLGTHMAGALIAAALMYVIARDRDDHASVALVGLLLGMAITTRLQHIALIPAVAVWLVTTRKRPSQIAMAAACSILGFLPQAVAWWAIYGTPLGPVTAGSGTWTLFSRNGLLPSLFSSYHGLFTWSPIAALALAGWAIGWREHRRVALFFTIAFVGEWFATSLLDCCFWGGLSFGARRLLDLAPMMAVGLVWLIARIPRTAITLSAVATIWSLLIASAVITGAMNLADDIPPAEFVETVLRHSRARLVERIVAESPLVRSPGRAAIAAAIVALTTVAAFHLFRRTRRALLIASLMALIFAAGVAATVPRTRARGAEEVARWKIDQRRARLFGGLADMRSLLRKELVYYRNRGKLGQAAAVERQLREIDARLAALSGGTRPPDSSNRHHH